MKRGLLLGGCSLVAFAVSALIMMKVLPGPLEDSDYLVVGSVSTLVSLLVLFIALISTMKSKEVFFRRRPKRPHVK